MVADHHHHAHGPEQHDDDPVRLDLIRPWPDARTSCWHAHDELLRDDNDSHSHGWWWWRWWSSIVGRVKQQRWLRLRFKHSHAVSVPRRRLHVQTAGLGRYGLHTEHIAVSGPSAPPGTGSVAEPSRLEHTLFLFHLHEAYSTPRKKGACPSQERKGRKERSRGQGTDTTPHHTTTRQTKPRPGAILSDFHFPCSIHIPRNPACCITGTNPRDKKAHDSHCCYDTKS